MVLGLTQIGVKRLNLVYTKRIIHYRASTRLGYQSFDNRLENETQVRTPIPRSLDSLGGSVNLNIGHAKL